VRGVWRERAFEIVLDKVWLTGVFDRVVIERNATGGAVRASVLIFKTDRMDDRGDAVARTGGKARGSSMFTGGWRRY